MAQEQTPADLSILESVATVPEHVVYRSFEAETVLLNIQTGQYHGVNKTGGRLLELLQQCDGALRSAVERLADEYQLDYEVIAPDLATFCSDLAERDLIELSPARA